MKKLFFLLVLCAVVATLLVKSKAVEYEKTTRLRHGVEYVERGTEVHWERVWPYIEAQYKQARERILRCRAMCGGR